MLKKLLSFTFLHKNQLDTPMPGSDTPNAWKAKLDSQAEQLQSTVNTLIDDLGATTAGDSGAKGIGVSPIAGVTGTNVQAVVEDLKLQVNGAVAGSIPDGSITQAKLAFAITTNAAGVTIADTGNHFTATNVEGALDELFTSASSVKTNVANAIGAPATSSDTGTVLANRITTEKGRLAAEIGDGNSSSALKYLADRLIARSDAIATAVNAKGVPATSADTLAQLGTKVGLIETGKRFANGQSVTDAGGNITVTGLSFTPSVVVWSEDVGNYLGFINTQDPEASYIAYASVQTGNASIFKTKSGFITTGGFTGQVTYTATGRTVKWWAYE